MSVLRNLEQRLSGLVEGTFGRVFRTEVGPVEISRRLTREMDQNVKVSLSRSYALRIASVTRASRIRSPTNWPAICSSMPVPSD